MSLIQELKRRNVFRVGIAYVLMGWVLLQAADFGFDLIDAPNWVIQALTIVVILGLPVALFFAWAFELTPEGIKREEDVDRSIPVAAKSSHKLNYLITGILLLIIVLFAVERFYPSAAPGAESDTTAAVTTQTTADTENEAGTSIAVLPFVNMSSDPEQEYFSDGITEEILNQLVRVPGLQVTARTSVFSFKGQNRDVREIAELLGVENILEGSVRRDGEQIRITAQLIRASDGFHLWSESFDRTLESIFAVQDEISNEIAAALQITLGMNARASDIRDANPEAYDLYLKASALHRGRGPGLLEAITSFERSITLDPNFAPAWAGLSQSLAVAEVYLAKEDVEPLGDLNKRRNESARKAMELAPDSPFSLHAMANDLLANNDWVKSETYFRRALQLDPDSTDIMEDYAHFLLYAWKPEEAVKVVNRMLMLDPMVPVFLFAGITVNHCLGDTEQRDIYIREGLRLGPDLSNIQQYEIFRLMEARDFDSVHDYIDQINMISYQVDRDALHKALDWVADPQESPDSEIMAALNDQPEFAHYAGRDDLFVRLIANQFDEMTWEARIANVHYVSCFSNDASFRRVLDYPEMKDLIKTIRLPEYWHEAGWPSGCEPLDNDDFICR